MLLILGCSERSVPESDSTSESRTRYLGLLDLNGDHQKTLPFTFLFDRDSALWIIENGMENIRVEHVVERDDSVFVIMPVFRSLFKLCWNKDTLVGRWCDPTRGETYFINFSAHPWQGSRFPASDIDTSTVVKGKWKVIFSPNEPDAYPAICKIRTVNGEKHGTFMTETGDYRFLQGVVDNGVLRMSCFDGSHAFLFEAAFDPDSEELTGQFYSGSHWQEPWVGIRDDAYTLRDPNQITLLREGRTFDFEVIDERDSALKFVEHMHQGRATLVQISGSWCPNCMDESRFIQELLDKYEAQGLQAVGVYFERYQETDKARKQIADMASDLGITYPMYYGGKASKRVAGEVFDCLNEISSFPTLIFVDRKGNVKRIHTGFYGPGTGPNFEAFKADTEAVIEAMMRS